MTPFYLQNVLGYRPAVAGLAVVPGAICMSDPGAGEWPPFRPVRLAQIHRRRPDHVRRRHIHSVAASAKIRRCCW